MNTAFYLCVAGWALLGAYQCAHQAWALLVAAMLAFFFSMLAVVGVHFAVKEQMARR